MNKTMKGNKDMSLQITHSPKVNKFMTDVIFVQVIFGRLRASSYNFENKEKYNKNSHFIGV